MPRKTIDVSRVKELANHMLEHSTDDVSPEARMMTASLLETILMETGNYHGYRYLPGIVEYDDVNSTVRHIGDESRRQYY